MFKKLKENKKGFTLVELIVVLVILAILAALLVPALTGYIDKAKRKSIVAETRQAVMAAQTLADEEYAKQTTGTKVEFVADTATPTAGQIKVGEISKLAEVSGTIGTVTVTEYSATASGGKVTKLEYTKGGMTCTYDPNNTINSHTDGDYTVVKAN